MSPCGSVILHTYYPNKWFVDIYRDHPCLTIYPVIRPAETETIKLYVGTVWPRSPISLRVPLLSRQNDEISPKFIAQSFFKIRDKVGFVSVPSQHTDLVRQSAYIYRRNGCLALSLSFSAVYLFIFFFPSFLTVHNAPRVNLRILY